MRAVFGILIAIRRKDDEALRALLEPYMEDFTPLVRGFARVTNGLIDRIAELRSEDPEDLLRALAIRMAGESPPDRRAR